MMKSKASPIWRLLGGVLIVALPGCAAAYHDYSDCLVPYLYCPPQPLPYVPYDGCHCPTPLASQYFEPETEISNTSASDADVPTEAPTPSELDAPAAPTSP